MGTRIAVMKDGVLQQVDTPARVYDRPANLFVAQFIGSPPMNLWEGERQGLPCMVGIRPEHIRPAGEGGIRAQVAGVERTGRETLVFLTIPGMPPLTMAADGAYPAQSGDHLSITWEQGRLHFFNRETGDRI